MLKIFLRWLLVLMYRVELTGLDNYMKAGNRVLIVVNHTSFLDPLLLGVFYPIILPLLSILRYPNAGG
jgi:acyl-[acyl-carrier-protein]-phospholipid O-acyltransferase/long-chain-fatty-acid--[acyl-carrier-protein] ligase